MKRRKGGGLVIKIQPVQAHIRVLLVIHAGPITAAARFCVVRPYSLLRTHAPSSVPLLQLEVGLEFESFCSPSLTSS